MPTPQPASYKLPEVTPAILERPAVSEGVLSGRPDVFGSVALRVSGTRLDGRWHRVENARIGGTAGRYAASLSGLDPVEAILEFAREKGITQIFIGHSKPEGAWRRLWRNSIERLIRSAEGIDVVVYPN